MEAAWGMVLGRLKANIGAASGPTEQPHRGHADPSAPVRHGHPRCSSSRATTPLSPRNDRKVGPQVVHTFG